MSFAGREVRGRPRLRPRPCAIPRSAIYMRNRPCPSWRNPILQRLRQCRKSATDSPRKCVWGVLRSVSGRRATAVSIDHVRFEERPPSPEDFVRLRAECGWGVIGLETARKALGGSIFDLTCFDGTELIGFGRVVGDGALYFYLQDVIVRPSYRGRSIGRQIVSRLTEAALARAEIGATIGLMSAKGKEELYRRSGFQERPTENLGAGMTRFVLT